MSAQSNSLFHDCPARLTGVLDAVDGGSVRIGQALLLQVCALVLIVRGRDLVDVLVVVRHGRGPGFSGNRATLISHGTSLTR